MSRWIGDAAVIAALSLTVAGVGGVVGLRVLPGESGPVLAQPSAASAGCRDAPLRQVGGSGVGGQVRVCLDDGGASVMLTAEHLTIGDAYAVWLTYLDRDRPASEESSGMNDPNRPYGRAERIDVGIAKGRQATFTAGVPGLRPAARSEIVARLYAALASAAPSALPSAPEARSGSLVALATFDLETTPPLPR